MRDEEMLVASHCSNQKGSPKAGPAGPASMIRSRVLSRHPSKGSYSSIAKMTAAGSWLPPKILALYEATYAVGLRKAGVPEE